MASLTYTNIETRVMNQLRIPTTNTVEQAKIQALINEVYRDIYAKRDWFWLIKRSVINTTARFNTGTVSISNLSTTGTITSTASIPALANFRFMPSGDTQDSEATYLVSSTHAAAGTAFAIDAGFTGVTSTGYGFVFSQDTYSLPADCQKVMLVRRYGRELPMVRLGIEDLSRLKIFDRTQGKPEVWSVFDFATTGDPTTARQLVVHPYPDRTYRLEIHYKQTLNTELSGTTRPLIPDDYVQLLTYGALSRGYPIFLNDTDRGKFFQSLFNDLLSLMTAAQHDYERDFPAFVPHDLYRQSLQRRRRAASGFTLGSLFDRWPTVP